MHGGSKTCQALGSLHACVALCTSGSLGATTTTLPGTYTTVASTQLGGHKPQLGVQQPGWFHRPRPHTLSPLLTSGGLMGLWSHPKCPDLGGPAVSHGPDDKTMLEHWPGTGCLITAAGWVVWGYYSSILYRDRFIRMDG